jgi:hypothetical protein
MRLRGSLLESTTRLQMLQGFGSTPLARISNADVRSSSCRPTRQRVDLDEPGGTALAYQPVLAEGDSGNRDFHSSRTLLGSISSGHALISRSR